MQTKQSALFTGLVTSLVICVNTAAANNLSSWKVTSDASGATLRLRFSENSPNPAIFASDEPPRLTIDLPATGFESQTNKARQQYDNGNISSLYVAAANGKTRVLLHLRNSSKYQLEQGEQTITIRLGPKTKPRTNNKPADKPSRSKAGKLPAVAKIGKGQYRGKPINMQFQDIDVRSALQVIAEVSNFNIVVNDSVSGNITLRLKGTPWDQALDVILTAKGLGKRVNGNVIYVAPVAELNKNEQMELAAKKTREQLTKLDTALIPVNYAKAKDIAALIRNSSSKDKDHENQSSEQDQLLSKRGSVNADNRTNSLLVMETAEKIARIKRLVKRLDIPVAQVLIESRIVIATNEFADELGVRMGGTAFNSGGNGYNAISGSAAANNAMLGDATSTGLPVNLPALGDRLAVNLPVANPAGRIGLALLNSDFLLDLELSALQAEGRGEIVSNPRVIASNQHQATIEQGIEIPYLSTSDKGTTVLFKKATLKLAVTPLITPDNRITLDLEVYKDNLGREVPSGQGGFIPSIDTRQLQTQVVTDDGQTVVLGGIYETTSTDSVSKVPLLGDLPLIGGLFRTTKKSDQKNELLIFITPKVIEENIKLEF